MNTTILALDLGTTTGWALRSRDGQIAHGFVSFKSQRFEGGGMRYLRFKRWLSEIPALAGEIQCCLLRGGTSTRRSRCRPRLWWLDGHAHHLVRAPQRALPRRARWHDQETRNRQGQCRQRGNHLSHACPWSPRHRRQRSRCPGHPALGNRYTGGVT
jgi:hypothetical protein